MQFLFHEPAKSVHRPWIFRQPYENKFLSIFLFTKFFSCDTLSSSAKFRGGIHSVAAVHNQRLKGRIQKW